MTIPSPICMARGILRTLAQWLQGEWDVRVGGCNYRGEIHRACWVLVLTCPQCGHQDVVWDHGDPPENMPEPQECCSRRDA